MVYLFLADGFEECEALIPLDILRRADVDVKTVGVGSEYITGSHKITVKADVVADEIILDDDLTAIILPGGMPGTVNLENNSLVQSAIDFATEKNLLICAICAAPQILGHKNLLVGKKATCFPGFENELYNAEYIKVSVIKDGNIITSCGAGAAFDFGFEILSSLKDKKTADGLRETMQCNV